MDSLYGQQELAEFCEFVIASLFEIAPAAQHQQQQQQHGLREGIDTPPYTPPLDGPSARKEPPILLEFIAYALYRTRLPDSIVHQSLLLLSHLKQRYPAARGTSSSPHRLFLSSLMLSAKISMDDTYSNKSWAIVGSNFFPLREVNQMERELFAFLGWNVVTQKDELDSFVASAQAGFKAAKSAKRSERAKRRRVEEDEAKEHRHRQATNAARALLRPHTYRHQSPASSAASSMQASPVASTSYAPTASTSASASASSAAAAGPLASCSSAPAGLPARRAHASSLSPPSVSQPQSSTTSPYLAHRRAYSHSRTQPHAHAYASRMSTASSSTSSSLASSRMSSAFPSASHSPTSPASEPLSAGPQTPDTDCHSLGSSRLYHQHAAIAASSSSVVDAAHSSGADFPEADAYVSKQKRSPLSSSTMSYADPATKLAAFSGPPRVVSPSLHQMLA